MTNNDMQDVLQEMTDARCEELIEENEELKEENAKLKARIEIAIEKMESYVLEGYYKEPILKVLRGENDD